MESVQRIVIPSDAPLAVPKSDASPAPPPSPPRPVTEPPRVERTIEPPLAPPRPVEAISVAVGGKDGQPRAEILLQHRGEGVIQMAVRTPDPQFASTLRSGLPELSANLEMRGFRSEIHARASEPAAAQQHHSGSSEDQPHRRPRWFYERNDDDN